GRRKRRDVKEGGVSKPELLARARMPHDGRADGARLQPVAVAPLDFNPVTAAIIGHLALVRCLEDGLPRQSEPLIEITYVHPLLFDEALLEPRRKPREDAARVGNRRCAPLLRRDGAVEENFHRPSMLIRILVMQEDALIRRVVGRGVDVACDATARWRAFLRSEERGVG